jgi:hypothetical protein
MTKSAPDGVDESARTLALFKFGRKSHLEKLREGRIYMKTVQYFAKAEESDPRFDDWEGVDEIIPGEGAIFSWGKDLQHKSELVGPIKSASVRTAGSYLFCMYAMDVENPTALFDAKKLGFGDHWVSVPNVPFLLTRIKRVVRANGLDMDWGRVTYLDSNEHEGQLGVFRKRDRYRKENEFRIRIASKKIEHFPRSDEASLELNVRDLSHLISPVYSVDELSHYVKIMPNKQVAVFMG